MQDGMQIPLTVLAGLVSEIDSPSVPPGSSPLCIDCDFTVSSVFSRDGIENVYAFSDFCVSKDAQCGATAPVGGGEQAWSNPTNIQFNTPGTYASVTVGS